MFFVVRYWPLAGGNDLLGQGGTGLLGSYAGLILPFAVSWYGVFLMRQYLLGIPDELLDAARVDGASEARIFATVVLPLARPALVTLGLFVFIYHWNEFLWTTTVTRTAPDLQTLPIGIYLLRSAFETPSGEALRQAALALSTLPLMALFAVMQRHYVVGFRGSGLAG
jgi:multiple sugar transport system permease protein